MLDSEDFNELNFENDLVVEDISAQSSDFITSCNNLDFKKGEQLPMSQMTNLKQAIDKEFNNQKIIQVSYTFPNYQNDQVIFHNNQEIPITIEMLENNRILVKVGPCDLSGVGGHRERAKIIKRKVNEALDYSVNKKINNPIKTYTIDNVNVSACIGVRGRQQLFYDFFRGKKSTTGNHMNAYIKTDNEKGYLAHWEPRNGPQRFSNNTICAMVVSTVTSLFEQTIRDNTVKSSKEATKKILLSDTLKTTFINFLNLFRSSKKETWPVQFQKDLNTATEDLRPKP